LPPPGPGLGSSLLVLAEESHLRFRHEDPEAVLALLDVPRGAVVADVGCGLGFYTETFAERVGESGMVYAVDVDPLILFAGLRRLDAAGAGARRGKVVPVWSKLDDVSLPKGSVDVLWMAHLDFLLLPLDEAGACFLASLRSALRPRGRLYVFQWMFAVGGEAMPPSVREAQERLLVDNVLAAGFRHELTVAPAPPLARGIPEGFPEPGLTPTQYYDSLLFSFSPL